MINSKEAGFKWTKKGTKTNQQTIKQTIKHMYIIVCNGPMCGHYLPYRLVMMCMV